MKIATFTFPLIPKSKVFQKKVIISFIIIVVAIVAIGGYFWLQKTGRISGFNLSALLGELTLPGKFSEEETETPISLGGSFTSTDFEQEVGLSPSPGEYTAAAVPGDGVTNLARKALKSYLEEKGQDLNLSPEQKIYIEDYIQNETGDDWVQIGETITFSEDLISEAISKSLELTPNQLENLEQYSSSVPSI